MSTKWKVNWKKSASDMNCGYKVTDQNGKDIAFLPDGITNQHLSTAALIAELPKIKTFLIRMQREYEANGVVNFNALSGKPEILQEIMEKAYNFKKTGLARKSILKPRERLFLFGVN